MPLWWLRTSEADFLIEAPHAKAAVRKAQRLGQLRGNGVGVVQVPDDTPGPRDRPLTRREARHAGIFGRPGE